MQSTFKTLGCAAVLITGAALAQSGRPTERDQRQQETPTTTPQRQTTPTGMIQQMEGTWKVDVRVDPKLWQAVKSADARTGARQGGDDADSSRATSTKSCTGYAVSGLIMGGDTIRTVFVSNDMGMDRLGDRPATQRALGTERMEFGPEAFRAVSYLAFDPHSNSFDAVFMDNQRSRIETHSGTYDASGNRLVLEPDRDSSKVRGRSSHWKGDCRVVVEMVSNDEYKVTMYASEAPSAGNDRSAPAGQSQLGGDVLYTATYRRATGADMTNINRALLADDGLFSTRGQPGDRGRSTDRTTTDSQDR